MTTMQSGAGVIPLSPFDLGVAAVLVLAAGAVSVLLRLKLERQLGIAALRTVVQLLLVGYILRVVFRLESLPLLVAVVAVMTIVASRAAVDRPKRRFRGAYRRAFITLVISGFTTTIVTTGVIIGAEPWYQPRYLIPILGMALGNGLTAVSLCMDQLLESLSERRAEVEMELALGATRWEAAREPLREAVRRGMIPTINSMTVVGIVFLPGMMTGQILAGADPLDAVKYQLVVMFMISAATALGCMLMALLVYLRLFNARHQLAAEAILKR